MENNVKNIYLFNLLKSPLISFTQEDSFLISRFLDLSNSIQLNRVDLASIATKCLKILNMSGDGIWNHIDRVCIVKTNSFSNQLQILSMACTDKLRPNGMDIGYNCFITEDTSLKKLKKGEVRICDDIDEIMESFKARNMPPQRSIKKLFDSGCRSSITLPLYFHDQHIGYFFLNSSEKNIFSNLRDEDYSIFCLLQNIFTNIIINELNQLPELSYSSSIFPIENKNKIQILQLKKNIENLFLTTVGYPIQISTLIEDDIDVLVPYRKFCFELALFFKRYLSSEHAQYLEFKFIGTTENCINLQVISNVSYNEQNEELKKSTPFESFKVVIDKNIAHIDIPYELTSAGCDYSIMND